MTDKITQAVLDELRELNKSAEKNQVLTAQMLKVQMEGTKKVYPPDVRNSPKPPSVLAQERQSETSPGTDSSAMRANREIHEKVVAPVLGGVIGKLFNKNKPTSDENTKPGMLATLKQALSPVGRSSSKPVDKNIPTPPAAKERRVVNKAEEVTITDISPKAKKGFGSIFSGLFTKSKSAKPTTQAGEKSSGGGFFSGILGMLLGSGSISGIGSMFTGMLLMPLLKAIGGGLMTVLTAPFKLAGWGLGKAVEGITWASRLVGKSKIGQMVGGLFTGLGDKISTGIGVIKNSRVGQAVAGLFTNISTRLATVGRAALTGLSKIPGVGRLVAGITTGIGSLGTAVSGLGGIGKLASKAIKFAGPVGAIIGTGISAFKGASSAIDEYKKSGSLSAAAREGLASFTESFTFGLLDKEMVSSGLSKAGDMISDVTDTVVGSVKSLWGKAKGFLFGSPHASTYVTAASDKIHDGTVQLADSSLMVANASKTFSQANKDNQQNLITSASMLNDVSADVSAASTINQQLAKDAVNRVTKTSESLSKINSAGLRDSKQILKQTETGTKSLGERVKEAFSKFHPLSIISTAATDTINTYKGAITRISKGESVLTVLGDTLMTNAKTAISAMGKLLTSPFEAIKGITGWFTKSKKQTGDKMKTIARQAQSTNMSGGSETKTDNTVRSNTATLDQMSKLTRVNQEMLKKAGKAPDVSIQTQVESPDVNVIAPPPTVIENTSTIITPLPVEKNTPRQLSDMSVAKDNIKLVNDVKLPTENRTIDQIKPIIIDRSETNDRINTIRDTQQQISSNKSKNVDTLIESHLTKLVALQEAQLQQAVTSNQSTSKMTETIQNLKPAQQRTNIINNNSTTNTTNNANSLDGYRNSVNNYNQIII